MAESHYERRYLGPVAGSAHLVRAGGYGESLCGLDPDNDWFGTGSQDEYEAAAGLPLCPRCAAKAERGGHAY